MSREKFDFFVEFSFLNTCALFACFFVKNRHKLFGFIVILIQQMLMAVDLSQSNWTVNNSTTYNIHFDI